MGFSCAGFGSAARVPEAADEVVLVGAFLLGPRARPLVICVSCGPGVDGSVTVALAGPLDSDSSGALPPLVAMGGGPRASIPARAGLNRPASLPPIPPCSLAGELVSLCRPGKPRGSSGFALDSVTTRFRPSSAAGSGAGLEAGLGEERVWLGILLGPGVGLGESGLLGAGVVLTSATDFLLAISALLASPSGSGASFVGVLLLEIPLPSAWAFLKSSFFFKIASLNSSTLSVFCGPPVWLRAAFPRRILSFNGSGATQFWVLVLRRVPKTFLNSGSSVLVTSEPVGRCRKDLRKSILGGASGLGLGEGAAGFTSLVGLIESSLTGSDVFFSSSVSSGSGTGSESVFSSTGVSGSSLGALLEKLRLGPCILTGRLPPGGGE